MRSLKHRAFGRLRAVCESCGFVIAQRGDYYSPIPSQFELQRTVARWAKPSALKGVPYDLEVMKTRLKGLRDASYSEFMTLPSYQSLLQTGYGPGFTHVDAFVLYAMLRQLKPRKCIEVGSGLSTCYSDLARQRNRAEGVDMQMVCIEPYPYSKLKEVQPVELIQSEVQNVPLATFQSLAAGDVLFIDSSHVVRLDGDVPYLFLEVLPSLAPGVNIHIHDVPFPYNIPYPPEYWTLLKYPQSPHWPMFWNEAMLLQAFLAFNRSFEISLSCPMIRHADEEFLRATLPIFQPVAEEPNTFSSIWLRRVE